MGLLKNSHDFMAMLSILLEKVIDSRTTSTLVKGCQPEIKDINEMYKEEKVSLTFTLNSADVQYLI